ncbi:hypothetical protein ACU686_44110 [Yinghuangia aomiensis]
MLEGDRPGLLFGVAGTHRGARAVQASDAHVTRRRKIDGPVAAVR